MVGDKMGEEIVMLEFHAAKGLTETVLRQLCGKVLEGGGKILYHITSNKENVHKFVKDGPQTQGVEVTKDEMCGFDHYARKYHFEYSMVREKNDKTQYLFLFKAKDIDLMENAMRDYFKDGRDHTSLKEKIEQAEVKAFNVNQARAKERTKEHVQSKNKGRDVER